MHRTGHYGAALICYAPLATVLIAVGAVEMAFAGGASSLVARCFQISTSVCPAFPIAARHTPSVALAVGAVLGAVGALIGGSGLSAVGAVAGTFLVAAHLLADALTPMRIRPFAPVRDTKYTLNVVQASSTFGNYLLLVAGIIVATGALYTDCLVAGMI